MSEIPKIRVGLEQSTPVKCDACGNETFVEIHYLRKISKLLTGSQDDMYVPIPAFGCAKCGHVNAAFRVSMPSDDKAESKPVSKIIRASSDNEHPES